MNLFINSVFQYFNKIDEWKNYKFSQFVLILMIFNGGKARIEGNLCFSEFNELLQKYYDTK